MQKIDVCIVDDHQIFRKAMIRLLNTFGRINRVSEAANGEECLRVVKEQMPHVVLLDMEMPSMNGAECAEHLINKFEDLKVIMLTMHDSEKYMIYMLEMGAHSFLLKNTGPDELEKAIYSVVDKDFYHNEFLTSVIRKSLKEKLRKERPVFKNEAGLTDREIEVMRMICNEVSLKEIAYKLSVSEKTIQTHKLNIQHKLNVKSTVGLVKYAYEIGLLH